MYYGSREWANNLLRYGIKVCKKRYDYIVLSNRIAEINTYIHILKEKGYTWHVERLQNWLHILMLNHKGVTKKTKTKTEKKINVPIIKSWQEWLNYLYIFNT